MVYTDHQRLELEKEFHYSRYITIRRKSELAANLGLTERQVCGAPTSATGAVPGVWPPGCQADYGAQSREENREVVSQPWSYNTIETELLPIPRPIKPNIPDHQKEHGGLISYRLQRALISAV